MADLLLNSEALRWSTPQHISPDWTIASWLNQSGGMCLF
jgi:hypothetical protein